VHSLGMGGRDILQQEIGFAKVGRLQYMIVLGSMASKKARVVQLWQLAMHMQWALIAQEALPGLWHLAILQEGFTFQRLCQPRDQEVPPQLLVGSVSRK